MGARDCYRRKAGAPAATLGGGLRLRCGGCTFLSRPRSRGHFPALPISCLDGISMPRLRDAARAPSVVARPLRRRLPLEPPFHFHTALCWLCERPVLARSCDRTAAAA